VRVVRRKCKMVPNNCALERRVGSKRKEVVAQIRLSRAPRAIESLRQPFILTIIVGEKSKFLCLHLVHTVIVSRATNLSLMLRSHMSAKRV
jgi:hypothetical protein